MSLAIAATYPGVFLSSSFDGALSREAHELRRGLEESLTNQAVSANRSLEIVSRLMQALQDATVDEFYALPESFCRALDVMESLPNHVPLPDVVVESDGEIGLDWEFGRRHVLTISVGEGPMLRFAALVNSEPVHGRVPFAGVFPATLSFFLDRLLASS